MRTLPEVRRLETHVRRLSVVAFMPTEHYTLSRQHPSKYVRARRKVAVSWTSSGVANAWIRSLVGVRLCSWSGLALATGYVALYLALDRLSFIEALHGIDITPWNPQPGLTLALLIVNGLGYVPAVIIAALLSSQLLPLVSVPLIPAFIAAFIIAGGYAAAAAVLRRGFGIDARLQRPRDIVLLIVVAGISAGLVALGFVTTYAIVGIIGWKDFVEATTQLWIGDAIGAIVVAPLVLIAVAHPPRRWVATRGHEWLRLIETAAQWGSIVCALALVFGFGHDLYSFRLFYLLFLPLVWIAARRGLVGATWAVLTIQVGLIAALEFQDRSTETVRTFQLLMFAVATTGLLLGAFVSERHRVARALAESQGWLAAILNTARDGVLTIDAKGRIVSVNPAIEQQFARPARHLVGQDVRDLIDVPDLMPSLASTARLPTTESSRRVLNARRGNGGVFPIELTVGQFGHPGDEHYTLVIRDITARRDAEARARLHQSELARASRISLAGEMASAVAHELNQPLTAIVTFARGCLRLVRHSPPRLDLLREGIEEVAQQAERAGDIIGRLRGLVRTGSCRRSILHVRALVDAAVSLAQTEATQNEVEIQVRIAPDLPPILADHIQIEQVLLNLMRNAMDAIVSSKAERRLITVEGSRAGERSVEIAVADTGPGVAEEVLGQLFEPFVTTKPSGMGLGLSISRSIIEAHESRLRLINRSGAGAVFTFDLPVHELSASQFDE